MATVRQADGASVVPNPNEALPEFTTIVIQSSSDSGGAGIGNVPGNGTGNDTANSAETHRRDRSFSAGGSRVRNGSFNATATRIRNSSFSLINDIGGRMAGDSRGRRTIAWRPTRSRFFPWALDTNPSEVERGHTESMFHTPEMLIFALGLAASLSLIVFVCDMMGNREFRPTSLLIFTTAGTYCCVLIKRQRALAGAERALMLEILEAPTSEAPRRYISKEERRARFHYFTFRPTAHGPLEKTCTGGGATPSPPRSPPPQYAHGRVEGGVAVVGADVDDKGLTPTGPATLKPRLRNGPAASASEGSPPAYNAAIAAVVEEGVSTEAGAVITVVGDVSERSAALHSCDGVPSALALSSTVAEQEDVQAQAERHPKKSGGIFRSRTGSGRGGCVEGGSAGGHGEVSCGGDKACGKMATKTVEEEKEKDLPLKDVESGTSWATDGSCIICFGEYESGDNLCRLPCRHTYHAECIDEWLDGANHAWCPLCKKDLISSRGGEASGNTTRNSSSSSNSNSNGGIGHSYRNTNSSVGSHNNDNITHRRDQGTSTSAYSVTATLGDEAV